MRRTCPLWVCTLLFAACGGGAATTEPAAEPIAEQREPIAAEEQAEPPAEDTEEIAAEEPEQPVEPPPAPIEPVTARTPAELREVLAAAATDASVLRRLVDAEHGIGVIDPDDAGILHYCDVERLTTLPGLGYTLGPEDAFTCDRVLDRCVAVASDGRGTVFYLRREGGAVTIDALAHYRRRPPTTDSTATRSFVRAGEGVCALYRALGDQATAAPVKLSVFVSAQTGLVPEVLCAQLCHAEARAAFDERVRPLLGSAAPTRCERNPTRCTYLTGDEETVVYGGADGVSAITITRPGMREDLERAQRRDLDAFLRAATRHTCPSEPPAPAAATE